MRFKRRKRDRADGPSTMDREAASADRKHLEEFVTTRIGVEGFLEPRTAVTEVTIVLIAKDGEWTRRRVPSAQWAHSWANKLGVPTYDAAVVGYPQRMREWNRRQKEAGASDG